MIAAADQEIDGLICAEGLPADFKTTVERFYRPVAEQIAQRRAEAGHTIIAGLCGPQGSGKSTMVVFLKLLLTRAGLRVAVLSIDDLYLTRAERERLAREVHPLLLTRGPPGTHDVAMGLALFDRLNRAKSDTRTLLPRFDKALDDRAPERTWARFIGPADVILFEGWCVGARPQPGAALAAPINELERNEDAGATWRNYVNHCLANEYQTLFARVDYLTVLKPPRFDCVFEWRVLQEDKLRTKASDGQRLMSRDEIARFIQHYERITRHILMEMPARADMIVDIDDQHRVTSVTART